MQVEINLLPQKKKSINHLKVLFITVMVLFILGMGGLAAIYYLNNQEITQLKAELQKYESKKASILTELAKSDKVTGSLNTEMEQVADSRVETVKVIEELLQPLQKGILSSITYDQDGNVKLRAEFSQLEDIAEYQQQLVKMEGMKGIQLINMSQKESKVEQAPSDEKAEKAPAEPSKNLYFAEFQVNFQPVNYQQQGGTQ